MSRQVTLARQPWPSVSATASVREEGGWAADPFADSLLMARAGFALLRANLRYWVSVAPLVREQLTRWERCAQAIPDPTLRGLAVSKLHEERFNVEAAATLATLATPTYRHNAVEGIVALQVAYDYLDLLSEQPLPDPSPDPLRDGSCLFEALIDALSTGEQSSGDYYRRHPRSEDGGYLRELVRTVRLALAKLPAAEAISEVALHAVERCVEAQVLSHTLARTGTTELERWARREATSTELQWPELFAGAAASVLVVHALIAAATDPATTHEDAERIDAVYLPICALTMLDSLVDREHDIATCELSYIDLYENHELMARRLARLARHAASKARALPNATHHIVTLVGVVAYYTSAPDATSAFSLPVTARMRAELQPLMTPTLAVMRVWRVTKRARARWA
jgi:tetraprenyl-beta-curcumene synthase